MTGKVSNINNDSDDDDDGGDDLAYQLSHRFERFPFVVYPGQTASLLLTLTTARSATVDEKIVVFYREPATATPQTTEFFIERHRASLMPATTIPVNVYSGVGGVGSDDGFLSDELSTLSMVSASSQPTSAEHSVGGVGGGVGVGGGDSEVVCSSLLSSSTGTFTVPTAVAKALTTTIEAAFSFVSNLRVCFLCLIGIYRKQQTWLHSIVTMFSHKS
jgi:hypothetical protein